MLRPAIDNLPRRAAGAMPPRRLTICLISEEFPPESWGGIGTYSFDLSRGLARLGHRVHVITRTWDTPRCDQVQGVFVHRLAMPEPTWRAGTWYINQHLYESRHIVVWNMQVRRAVGDLIERESLDVIECPEYHAQGLLAALSYRRVPLVVKLHTPAFMCRRINGTGIGGGTCDTRISEHLEYRLAVQAALLTAPSRTMAADVADAWQLNRQAVRVVPNPIDEKLFSDSARAGQARDENTLLFVGRLERRKGVEALARAMPAVFRACPGIRLKLVGSDHPSGPRGRSMAEHLKTILGDAGADRVDFAGPVPRDSIVPLYHSAAVCVVPSLYESFGYTCIEAMASGGAVVAADGGALGEIVTHERDGLLFGAGDAEGLSRALIRLFADPALRQELGTRAQQTVRRRFGLEAVAAQTVEAYETVLKRRCGA